MTDGSGTLTVRNVAPEASVLLENPCRKSPGLVLFFPVSAIVNSPLFPEIQSFTRSVTSKLMTPKESTDTESVAVRISSSKKVTQSVVPLALVSSIIELKGLLETPWAETKKGLVALAFALNPPSTEVRERIAEETGSVKAIGSKEANER